jgi:hypothetical protein
LVRLIGFFLNKRISSGPLLRTSITSEESAQIKDLEALFHKYLTLVRDIKPNLIPEDLDISIRYSVKRSLWRGSTSQARNKKVPRDIINLNNRWQSEDAAGFCQVGGGEMMEDYTDVQAAVETLLQYSEPL